MTRSMKTTTTSQGLSQELLLSCHLIPIKYEPMISLSINNSLATVTSGTIFGKMSSSLQRLGSQSRNACQSGFPQIIRRFSTDSLSVEYKAGEIGTVSGIPDEHLQRRVLIYSPARTASQQGSGKVGKWKINFMSTHKWENPLMGWTSTGDPYSHVGDSALSFDSEEDSKAFAERHGWDYEVKKHQTPLMKVKAYADNFKWKGLPKTQQN